MDYSNLKRCENFKALKLSFFIGLKTLLFLGSDLDISQQKKIEEIISMAQTLAANETLVTAVEAHNSNLPEEYKHLTNDIWKKFSPKEPLVKTFSQNKLAEVLKKWVPQVVTEVFVSGNDGKKVAFINKTTSWDHSGKPKHETPMKGKIWKGSLERDESTGINQIQISVPVLKKGKPIGSIVVGIAVARL